MQVQVHCKACVGTLTGHQHRSQGWTLAYSGRRVSLAWQAGPAVGPGSKKSRGSWYGLGPGENAQAATPPEGQPRQWQWLQEEAALADEYVFKWSDVSIVPSATTLAGTRIPAGL